MVVVIPYPKKLFIPGLFFTDVNDVIGKRLTISIAAQTPLTNALVTDLDIGSQQAKRIPAGMVAISIPMESPLNSLGYVIRPGDHVNVIGSMMFMDVDQQYQSKLPNKSAGVFPVSTESLVALISAGDPATPQGKAVLDESLNQPVYLIPSEEQRPRLVSQTLLQNVVVLEVGEVFPDVPVAEPTQPEATPIPLPGENQTTRTITRPKLITLIVTPQDSVALNYLMYSGVQINLALRSAGDDQDMKTDSVTLLSVMEKYNIKLPSKQTYTLEPSISILSLPDVETIPIPY